MEGTQNSTESKYRQGASLAQSCGMTAGDAWEARRRARAAKRNGRPLDRAYFLGAARYLRLRSAALEALGAFLTAKPSAPFAVLAGLQGGYLADSVEHCADIEEARGSLADAIERSADHLAELVSGADRLEDMSAAIERMGALAAAAQEVKTMPADKLAEGFSIETGAHHALWLVPLDPADYDPEGCD
jgi:hypothetical protein